MRPTILVFLLFCTLGRAQTYSDFAIDHHPFITLTANPLSVFDIHNTFQFGGEIAPSFGKFSLQADYGTGARFFNLHRNVRDNFDKLNTQIFRGELKTYQSDWFYFTSLDKKPFGRYFSLEYMNKQVNATRNTFLSKPTLVSVTEGSYKLAMENMKQKEQVLNLKYGKHFLIKRFLVFDVFAGVGVRHYQVVPQTTKNIYGGYWGYVGLEDWLPYKKRFLPNGTAGFRLCAYM